MKDIEKLLKDNEFIRPKCKWFIATSLVGDTIKIYLGTSTSYSKSAFYRLLKKTYPHENYKNWFVSRLSDVALDMTRVCLLNDVELKKCYEIATYEILNCIDKNRNLLYNDNTQYKVESLNDYFKCYTKDMTYLYYQDKEYAFNTFKTLYELTLNKAFERFVKEL